MGSVLHKILSSERETLLFDHGPDSDVAFFVLTTSRPSSPAVLNFSVRKRSSQVCQSGNPFLKLEPSQLQKRVDEPFMSTSFSVHGLSPLLLSNTPTHGHYWNNIGSANLGTTDTCARESNQRTHRKTKIHAHIHHNFLCFFDSLLISPSCGVCVTQNSVV